jgi:hypothetical protein
MNLEQFLYALWIAGLVTLVGTILLVVESILIHVLLNL